MFKLTSSLRIYSLLDDLIGRILSKQHILVKIRIVIVTCSDIRDVSFFLNLYVYTFGRPHQIFLLLRDLHFILEIVTLGSKNSLGGLRYIIIY